MISKPAVLTLCAAVVLALTGCGGSGSATAPMPSNTPTPTPAPVATPTATPSPATVEVSTSDIAGLGQVLVDGQGRTLYMFVPDKHSQVTCTSTCAAVWPPMKVASGQSAVASGQAQSSLLGTDPDPAGGSVVTYAGWPLYTYIADTAPGKATGQAIDLNGGLWYVLSPAGQVIKTKPTS
ncbi:MAG: hypothetical protein ACREQM_04320 [Candidatus Dormibacteraceae bacterium]